MLKTKAYLALRHTPGITSLRQPAQLWGAQISSPKIPPPHPCRLAQNPVRRALKFSGFVGVQLHGSIFVENHEKIACWVARPVSSGPAQPATRLLARPVSPAHPASGLKQPSPSTAPSHPASQAQPAQPRPRRISGHATRPAPSSQPTSRLSPACQGQV